MIPCQGKKNVPVAGGELTGNATYGLIARCPIRMNRVTDFAARGDEIDGADLG